MTIYDQDFMAEQAMQQEYQKGVTDPAAGDQEASAQVAEAPKEQPVEQAVEPAVPVESDKEFNFRALR